MSGIDQAVIWRVLRDSRRYFGLSETGRLRDVRARRDGRCRTMRRSRRDYPEDADPGLPGWDRRQRRVPMGTQQEIGAWW